MHLKIEIMYIYNVHAALSLGFGVTDKPYFDTSHGNVIKRYNIKRISAIADFQRLGSY